MTGAITGILALGAANKAHDGCPNQQCASTDGVDAASHAKTMGLVSTIAFGVGILGAAAGTYLWIKSSPTVMVGPSVGGAPGLAMRASF